MPGPNENQSTSYSFRIPPINNDTHCLFINQKGSNVLEFIPVPIAYAKAHPDRFPQDMCVNSRAALAIAQEYGEKKGWQMTYDENTGTVSYKVPVGEGQTYIDTSNNGSIAVDNTDVNEDSGMFDGDKYENLARSLFTYGNLLPSDSTAMGNFEPIDISGTFEESDGTLTPSMMTAYGPNNADGSRQMYLITKSPANDGQNVRGTLRQINFNNDSTSVVAPLRGLQVDKTGHFKEDTSSWGASSNNGYDGTINNIINTRQNRGFYEDYMARKKAEAEREKKAYGGRLYSRGGRIQTRPAPNSIRAQNGLKLRKADGMGSDEYDVYL